METARGVNPASRFIDRLSLPPARFKSHQIDEMHQHHNAGGQAGQGDDDPGHHTGFEFVMFGKMATEREDAEPGAKSEADHCQNKVFGRGHNQPFRRLDRASLSVFRQSFNGPLGRVFHGCVRGMQMGLCTFCQLRPVAIANGIKDIADKLIPPDPFDR